ncbi:hypothetical protein [Parasegetibacter sp. NRK P23]|uniref:hypothetical protein n=1 Tax=Parasegetibacter sp. NRK P23 TaxID=2942999 RepID=UPI002044840A|nr:hypothetical protein [Parasegetibacter sp. NRK P23]MCM5530267.1 hypothetical protein [Parasegetibacter sp. NRK P23]
MQNIDIILTLLTVLAAFLGLLAMLRILLKLRRPNVKLNTDFFEQLDKKFDLRLVNNKEDITTLADSFRREHLATYELTRLLEDYLRYLINKASNSEGDIKQSYVDRHQKANQILKEEKEEKPYDELPIEERRIFRAINSSVKTGEKEDVLNSLEDLRILISTKSKIYQQSNTINKFSIPLAVIGLILTIYFGIKSLPKENAEQVTTTTNNVDSTKSEIKDTLNTSK